MLSAANKGGGGMTMDRYACLCCGPVITAIFQQTALAADKTESPEHCDHRYGGTHESTGVSRREFIRSSAAVAGAVLAGTSGLTHDSAHAQASTTRVFTGGTILTVDKNFSEARAIAIRGNKIIAVGSDAEVRKSAGSNAEIIDLRGRVMLPGFIDPHTHMMSGSR